MLYHESFFLEQTVLWKYIVIQQITLKKQGWIDPNDNSYIDME